MTEIGGRLYLGKITKGLPLISIPKISKKSQEKDDGKKKYMRLISIGMIGNSNYIGTSLSELIQEVKSKEKTYSVPSKKYFIDKDFRTAHLVGH